MIGQRLISLRGIRTQQEVADAIGISRARYSHYENGRNEPDLKILRLLADYHNVTIDYLLGREDKVREVSGDYSTKVTIDLRELADLFIQEPECYRFWLEFKKANVEKRKEFLRLWKVLSALDQEEKQAEEKEPNSSG